TAAAAQGNFAPQDALRAPGWAEPAADRDTRLRPRRRSLIVSPLSRIKISQRVQAGRHAAAHGVQVVAHPVRARKGVSRFWSDRVAGLTPYTPGEQSKIERLLKLNTNEHPYGPSPRALEAIRRGANDALRLYPDNESTALREAVAGFYGVKPAQVMPGNGSDEVLAHVFNALFRHAGRPLLMPDITYSFYKTYCKLFDIPARLIPLADDFSIRPDDYLNHDEPPAGIIFANPNAPTGIALGLDDIECIARGNPDIAMVVDEAYVDFGADSAIALLDRCPNIVVIHTLSKSRALAGMRVGYSVASVEITEGIL